MKQKLLLFTVLMTLAFSGVYAQAQARTLSADEAVHLALENNLSLKRNTIDLDGKKRASDRSWNSLIPSLTAGVGASHATSLIDELPPGQDAWRPGLSFSAGLTLSVSTVNNIKKARSDYEAGLLSYEQARRELELQVRKLFYQILLLDADRELAAKSLESAEARYEQITARVRTGQAARLEEMSARVDLENQRPNVRNAELVHENALDSLRALLGVPAGEELVLSGTLDIEGNGTLSEIAAGESIESSILKRTITSLELQRDAAKTDAYAPTLRLSWTSSPTYTIDTEKWNDNGNFNATLSFNLENFFPVSAAKTRIDNLNDSIRSTQIQLAETIRNSETRISQYRRTIEQKLQTLAALRLNEELAQTTYDLYDEAYLKGASDYQRLRDAADSLLQAQNRVRQEQYNLISTILDLEKELGVLGTIK